MYTKSSDNGELMRKSWSRRAFTRESMHGRELHPARCAAALEQDARRGADPAREGSSPPPSRVSQLIAVSWSIATAAPPAQARDETPGCAAAGVGGHRALGAPQ